MLMTDKSNRKAEMPELKRIMLKLSGEALMGVKDYGIDPAMVARIAREVKEVHDNSIQVCIVVGAGNIFRGMSGVASGIDRTSADHMGMLATVMNSIAIQSALEEIGLDTRVQSAFPIASVCEPYIRRKAMRHMEKGRVVVFAAGTGNPFFTTDSAAALRAAEMNCDGLFKGTQVDGIYNTDPKKDVNAKKYDTISFMHVLRDDLKVMDAAAIALCRENNIPIIVFSLENEGNLNSVIKGEGAFTIVQ